MLERRRKWKGIIFKLFLLLVTVNTQPHLILFIRLLMSGSCATSSSASASFFFWFGMFVLVLLGSGRVCAFSCSVFAQALRYLCSVPFIQLLSRSRAKDT